MSNDNMSSIDLSSIDSFVIDYDISNNSILTFESKNTDTFNVPADKIDIGNGRTLSQFIEELEKKLLILRPDPEKLEKYEALRQAYEQYKILEALLYDEESNKK